MIALESGCWRLVGGVLGGGILGEACSQSQTCPAHSSVLRPFPLPAGALVICTCWGCTRVSSLGCKELKGLDCAMVGGPLTEALLFIPLSSISRCWTDAWFQDALVSEMLADNCLGLLLEIVLLVKAGEESIFLPLL